MCVRCPRAWTQEYSRVPAHVSTYRNRARSCALAPKRPRSASEPEASLLGSLRAFF